MVLGCWRSFLLLLAFILNWNQFQYKEYIFRRISTRSGYKMINKNTYRVNAIAKPQGIGFGKHPIVILIQISEKNQPPCFAPGEHDGLFGMLVKSSSLQFKSHHSNSKAHHSNAKWSSLKSEMVINECRNSTHQLFILRRLDARLMCRVSLCSYASNK